MGDSAPFWGGAAIDRLVDPILRTYVYCTTAFPVRKSNGQDAMLTAHHCGTNEGWRTPDGDRFVGRSEAGSADLDSTVLTGSEHVSAIYVGPWDADSTSARSVAGTGNPALNSYVFASGSWSGASTLLVIQLNRYITIDGQRMGPGFWVETSRASPLSERATVVGPLPDRTAVMSVEFWHGGDLGDRSQHPGACTGMNSDGRQCAWRSFHINIDDSLRGLGLTIKTG